VIHGTARGSSLPILRHNGSMVKRRRARRPKISPESPALWPDELLTLCPHCYPFKFLSQFKSRWERASRPFHPPLCERRCDPTHGAPARLPASMHQLTREHQDASGRQVIIHREATATGTAHRRRLRAERDVAGRGSEKGLGDGEQRNRRREEERLGTGQEGEPGAVEKGREEGWSGRGTASQSREIGFGPQGGGDAGTPRDRQGQRTIKVGSTGS
jgi:hypothetical protein